MLTSGSSISGPGGDLTILAGMSQTGAAGENLLQAGGTTSGTVGAIKLGGTTPAPNSTAQGTIRVHVVGGDINVTVRHRHHPPQPEWPGVPPALNR